MDERPIPRITFVEVAAMVNRAAQQVVIGWSECFLAKNIQAGNNIDSKIPRQTSVFFVGGGILLSCST